MQIQLTSDFQKKNLQNANQNGYQENQVLQQVILQDMHHLLHQATEVLFLKFRHAVKTKSK